MWVINSDTYVFVLNYLGYFGIMFFISNQTTHIHSSLIVTLKEKTFFVCIDASGRFVRRPKFWLQITCVVALLTQDFIDTYCDLRIGNVAFLSLLLSTPYFSRHIMFCYQYSYNKYYLKPRDSWYIDLLSLCEEFGSYYYLIKVFEGPQDLILRWPLYLFCNRTTRKTC